MAKYDIYRFRGGIASYVLEVQADILSDLNTVVIVPLVKKINKNLLPNNLNPILIIDDEEYIMVTTDISTIKRSLLDTPFTNVTNEYEYDINNALDFLFQGF